MGGEYSLTKPCGKCPFGRGTEPGCTGGADELVYVGQISGNFWLPCHLQEGYVKGQGDETLENTDPGQAEMMQCAGAAIFRANLGLTDKLSSRLHRLPPDENASFTSFEEFVSHHRRIPIHDSKLILEQNPPAMLMQKEIDKAGLDKLMITAVFVSKDKIRAGTIWQYIYWKILQARSQRNHGRDRELHKMWVEHDESELTDALRRDLLNDRWSVYTVKQLRDELKMDLKVGPIDSWIEYKGDLLSRSDYSSDWDRALNLSRLKKSQSEQTLIEMFEADAYADGWQICSVKESRKG